MLALVYLVERVARPVGRVVRVGFRVLLYGAFPAYIVMRVAAQWIYSKEGLDDLPTDPSWLGIGFSIADGGLLFLLIATIVAGRRRPAGAHRDGRGGRARPPVRRACASPPPDGATDRRLRGRLSGR